MATSPYRQAPANFASGLAEGLQDAQDMRAQDERLNLAREAQYANMIQQAQQAKYQQEQSARADEALSINRETALRQNRMSDLQYEEAQRKANEDRAYREDQKRLGSFWEPQTTVGADGTEVTTKKDWNNPTTHLDFQNQWFQNEIKHGRVSPESANQFMALKTKLEASGADQVIRSALGGDQQALTALGGKLGLTGLTPVLDRSGPIPMTGYKGMDASGKVVVIPAAEAAVRIGSTLPDPDAPAIARNKALDDTLGAKSDREYKTKAGDAATVQARAAMINAGAHVTSANASAARARDPDRVGNKEIAAQINGVHAWVKDTPQLVPPQVANPALKMGNELKNEFITGFSTNAIRKYGEQGQLLTSGEGVSMAVGRYKQIEGVTMNRLETMPEWKAAKGPQARYSLYEKEMRRTIADLTKKDK